MLTGFAPGVKKSYIVEAGSLRQAEKSAKTPFFFLLNGSLSERITCSSFKTDFFLSLSFDVENDVLFLLL